MLGNRISLCKWYTWRQSVVPIFRQVFGQFYKNISFNLLVSFLVFDQGRFWVKVIEEPASDKDTNISVPKLNIDLRVASKKEFKRESTFLASWKNTAECRQWDSPRLFINYFENHDSRWNLLHCFRKVCQTSECDSSKRFLPITVNSILSDTWINSYRMTKFFFYSALFWFIFAKKNNWYINCRTF